jgi:hypothetical protein
VLAGPWVRNELWRRARAVPSLDLRFAESKSLVDSVSGQNLITFTRASTGTFVDSDGVIRSAGNDVARFDHNPLTGECLGLLVEEQRSNIAISSQVFSGAPYSAFNTTVAGNQISAPDGTSTAASVLETATTGGHNIARDIGNKISVTASTVYTFSVFLKANGRDFVQVTSNSGDVTGNPRANFNISNGTLGTVDSGASASISRLSNGWVRIAYTVASAGTLINFIVSTVTSDNAARFESFAGDITKGFYIWGYSCEAGAFPTSYIPTTGTAATRTADIATITETNMLSWFTSFDENTFYVETGLPPSGSTSMIAEGLASGALVGVSLSFNNLNTRFRNIARHGSSRFDPGNANGGLVNGPVNKAAMGTSASGSQSADNGVLPSPSVAPAQSDWVSGASLALGKRSSSASLFLNSTIRRLTFWPTRLPNSTLQSITL